MTGNPQVMDVLDRRLGLALTGTKGAEVMGAYQILGGQGHALDIQRPMVPGHFLAHMRRTDLIVVDHIAVTPGNCLEARMKIRRHFLGPGHADVVRQVDIGAHGPGLHAAHHLGVEMHHLAAGMNASIGTPGTKQ
ncbi:hypothetical protein D3C77_590110 [compost metagenome]